MLHVLCASLVHGIIEIVLSLAVSVSLVFRSLVLRSGLISVLLSGEGNELECLSITRGSLLGFVLFGVRAESGIGAAALQQRIVCCILAADSIQAGTLFRFLDVLAVQANLGFGLRVAYVLLALVCCLLVDLLRLLSF
jgi:hypothetical protein